MHNATNRDGRGLRYDSNKPRLDLIPMLALEQAARVLEFGAGKYGMHNWARGMAWSRVVGCILRHLSKIQQGEVIDEESGLPHSAHVLCNALFLATYEVTYPEGNDYSSTCFMPPSEERDLAIGGSD